MDLEDSLILILGRFLFRLGAVVVAEKVEGVGVGGKSSLAPDLGKLGNWLDPTSLTVVTLVVVLGVEIVGLVKGLAGLTMPLGVVVVVVVVVWGLCGKLNSFLTSSNGICGLEVVGVVVADAVEATASNETSLGDDVGNKGVCWC